MVIDETKGINYFTQWYIDLLLSNIQYSPLKKQSENSTTSTTRKRKHPQILSKPSPILIWNRNNELYSRDLPVPSLPVLLNDLPLPLALPSRFSGSPRLALATWGLRQVHFSGPKSYLCRSYCSLLDNNYFIQHKTTMHTWQYVQY